MSLSYRILKYITLSILSLTTAAVLSVEGIHQYVEFTQLPPSLPSPGASDEEEWEYSNPQWTGGAASGTSTDLTIYQRHLLRSAWIAQSWGSGSPPSSISSSSFHPDFVAVPSPAGPKGMIGHDAAAVVNKVDRGYQLALDYIEAVIQATKSSLEYPANLSVHRPALPSHTTPSATSPPPSLTALDVLNRQAELLELIGTKYTLSLSLESYERVLLGMLSISGAAEPRVLALAKKLGDLNARLGQVERGRRWWAWGLDRVGVDVAGSSGEQVKAVAGVVVGQVKERPAGWFPSFGFGTAKSPTPEELISTPSPMSAGSTPPNQPTLSPPVLRAALGLLESYATDLAISSKLSASERVLDLERGLIQSSLSLNSTSTSSTSSALQSLYLKQRQSLISLHLAELTYAQTKDARKPVDLLEAAAEQGEQVLLALTGTSAVPGQELDPSLPSLKLSLATTFAKDPRGILKVPGEGLLKDTQRTIAESYGLLGLLRERSARSLGTGAGRREEEEQALEAYERAVGWSRVASGLGEGEEGGEVVGGGGEEGRKRGEWARGRGRMRERLGRLEGL